MWEYRFSIDYFVWIFFLSSTYAWIQPPKAVFSRPLSIVLMAPVGNLVGHPETIFLGFTNICCAVSALPLKLWGHFPTIKQKIINPLHKESSRTQILIQMSDHTLVFVVQPPNSQKPHTSTHVLLFTFIPLRKNLSRQFFDILSKICHFWILWKKIQSKLYGKYSKLEKTTKQVQTHKIFIITLIKKFSVADYWYMLYKFTQYTWALSSSLFCHI